MVCLVIAQIEPTIEVWSREPRGSWRHVLLSGLARTLARPAIGLSIPLAAIYAGTSLVKSTD